MIRSESLMDSFQLGPIRPLNDTSQPDWAGDVSFMGPVVPARLLCD